VVIFDGLATSTLLNLFVVPSLYLRFANGWRIASEPGRFSGSVRPTPAT
jgi:Cu/Ag efflux pump CusA